MDNLAAYWITIAHLPRWTNAKINSLIKSIYHDRNSTLDEFFSLKKEDWNEVYGFDAKDIEVLSEAKGQLANNSFLAESLLNQGFEIIPLTHSDYSATLKQNLKLAYSPPVLYIKGNKQLLQEDSIAIVGSRNASEKGLLFTDVIAKQASEKFKVVVSGFAKGIDKAALDFSLKYTGQSIIVLPQGVLTFGSSYKKYYKQIINGDVLILSTFHPKAPWKVELAMARNPIIYGLAHDIYVAESAESGGTWSGVKDGLRKGRTIYVRYPERDESNANLKLISLGAAPVDSLGNLMEYSPEVPLAGIEKQPDDAFAKEILQHIAETALSAKELCEKTECGWTSRQMTEYLKKMDSVEIVKKGNLNKYIMKSASGTQQTIDDLISGR